jgi:glycosyltransferase involved in cell wall biosynthesis
MAPGTETPQVAHVDVMLSVVIPTFRREEQVVAAVQSVLSSTPPSTEVLVLDDTPEGSASGAISAIGDDRVRYEKMPEPSGGRPAAVRNRGIEQARGRYLYFLDDDDRVAPGALSALVRALEGRPKAGVAYGTVECVGPDEDRRRDYNRWFQWAASVSRRVQRSSWRTTGIIMFRGTLIINSACMIRRACARELGGYDLDLPVYEDVEFFTRGIRRFGHVFVDVPVLTYSTGLPSIIHDLGDDNRPVGWSYERMHAKYKATYGVVDYRCLQIASKLARVPPVPTERRAAKAR